jgi:hypothetical protein
MPSLFIQIYNSWSTSRILYDPVESKDFLHVENKRWNEKDNKIWRRGYQIKVNWVFFI